jgi:DNA mismatch endonuclease (patch repair protein)
MDIFTPEKRSEVMSRIRGRDTQPELALRSMLHRLGYRFTVHGPKNKSLPGRPDLVLPKYRTVIFVHGCFWHGHEHCPYFRLPKSRHAFWKAKIDDNPQRDHVKAHERGRIDITQWRQQLDLTDEAASLPENGSLA